MCFCDEIKMETQYIMISVIIVIILIIIAYAYFYSPDHPEAKLPGSVQSPVQPTAKVQSFTNDIFGLKYPEKKH